jgi:hypothetical protein
MRVYVCAPPRESLDAIQQSLLAHLCRSLEHRLAALLRSSVSVIESNDIAPVDRLGCARSCDQFLFLLSPASARSEACRADLRAFCSRDAPANGSTKPWVIVLGTIEPGDRLDELRLFKTFHLSFDTDAHAIERRLWTLIDDLTDDMAPAPTSVRVDAPAIFVAETGADLENDRERIRRELSRHGYQVLPEGTLPVERLAFERTVIDLLRRSTLSVHLIGGQAGSLLSGTGPSPMEIQHLLALAACREDARRRQIVWIPPGIAPADERQRTFIEALMRFSEAEQGTEIVRTSIEDVKTLIADKLRPASRREQPRAVPGDAPQVYVVYDRPDAAAVAPLEEYFGKLGIPVIPSAFDGDQSELRERHHENLRTCDAALIVYGSVREPWVRIKQQDLMKSAGLGRLRRMIARAVYLCPEMTESKLRFNAQDLMILKNDGATFSPESIRPFVDSLRAASRGAAS